MFFEISHMQVVPVVDGNVVRVIARLKTISRNPKDTATIKEIWSVFLSISILCFYFAHFSFKLPQDSNYMLGHFSHLLLCIIHFLCIECNVLN